MTRTSLIAGLAGVVALVATSLSANADPFHRGGPGMYGNGGGYMTNHYRPHGGGYFHRPHFRPHWPMWRPHYWR